jgi:hypothetical protein
MEFVSSAHRMWRAARWNLSLVMTTDNTKDWDQVQAHHLSDLSTSEYLRRSQVRVQVFKNVLGASHEYSLCTHSMENQDTADAYLKDRYLDQVERRLGQLKQLQQLKPGIPATLGVG